MGDTLRGRLATQASIERAAGMKPLEPEAYVVLMKRRVSGWWGAATGAAKRNRTNVAADAGHGESAT